MTSDKEENPFTEELVANEWINSVENEKGEFRDLFIYPALESWYQRAKPPLVVEIGSGQGICSQRLGPLVGKYVGVEPSLYLTDRAVTLYKDNDINFVLGSAYEIPLQSTSVDATFLINVWFHLKEIQNAAREIARILKKNGELFMITANPDKYSEWEKFFGSPVKVGNRIEGKVRVPVNALSRNVFYEHSIENTILSLENAGFAAGKVEPLGSGNADSAGRMFIKIIGKKIA